MAVTPIYNLPYQALTDAPDGAGLGQNGFLAVEAQLVRIDAAAAAAAANYTASSHGIVGGTRYTGTGALVFSGAPEALTGMQTGSLVLKANRMFRIKVKFKITYSSSSVTSVIMRLRDGSLVGAEIGEMVVDGGFNSSSGHTFYFETDYETIGSVTKNFVLTMVSNGASSTINGGGSTNPTYVEIEDVGPSGIVTIQSTP
jgi:hypothetical protein